MGNCSLRVTAREGTAADVEQALRALDADRLITGYRPASGTPTYTRRWAT
ncbi:hypothetical protein ACFV2X_32365 [Streptomyces sp. NPDC059679]